MSDIFQNYKNKQILIFIFSSKQTEIWNFETKKSKSVGTKLDRFSYYPHLYIVHTDECSACSTEKDCGNGNCIRSGGGDECRCDVGYENQNGDRLLPCFDIDECQETNCGLGVCENSAGSYTCRCNQGYTNIWNDPSNTCGKLVKHFS